MASTSTTMTVKLADTPQVQRLVLAAATIIDGVGVEWVRATPVSFVPVPVRDLAELLAALEALEAAK